LGISLSHTDKIVSITSPTTEVTIQELVSVIREWEDELENMTIPFVIWTDGKTDLGGSIYTAITLTLNDEWQIQFWNGVSLGIVKEGNLVGGVGGVPIKPTGGSDTIVVNNQVGGVLIVSGSGVTEQDKIDIIKGVSEGNTSYEFVECLVQNNDRNVAIGKVDYMIVKIKATTDPDWSSPILTQNLYYWYETLGDDDPIEVKEAEP